jgi:peptidyl-prolyl cis-trans isomerase C
VFRRFLTAGAPLVAAATIACAAPADQTRPEGAAPPPAAAVPRELPAVVARVNNEAIERWEVEAAIREITLATLHPIPQEQRDELVRTVLARLIEHHLASQIARTRGVGATEAELDDDLKQMRREQPSEKAFEDRLSAAGVSAEQLRHQRHLSVDMAKLVQAAGVRVAVSDADVNAYYRDNRERFLLPDAVTASHILVRAFPDSTAEQRAEARRRATDILNQILGGADFARVARDQSEDAGTALSGGLLGTFPRGQMHPAFDAAAFAVKPGEISDLVETPFGFHIIRVDERVQGRMQTLDEVREDIKALLSDRASQEGLTKLIEDARRTAKIEIYI